MQKEKILVIVLIVINIALIGVCGYSYVTQDRLPPKISFSENDTVYTHGIAESELLKGVGATDKQDGDVSNRVVIEKILENAEKGNVVVYYAACDYSGNVAKASREFPAKFKSIPKEQSSQEQLQAQ